MKRLLLSLGLIIGLIGVSHAGGRQDNGWIITTVTGTAQTVASVDSGLIFLKSIWMSSGSCATDYVVVMNTVPSPNTGAGTSLIYPPMFSTSVVVGPIVYTSTFTNIGFPQGQQRWTAGDCEGCFIEVGKTLHVRQTTGGNGGSNIINVMWSR